jgi:CheY-like chemotaxis protein
MKTIVLFENDKDIAEVVKIILEPEGYNLIIRDNVDDNIDNFVCSIMPDFILLDLRIPDIGGKAAAKILKNNPFTMEIPIIFFSADNGIKDIAEQYGVQYFAKPFDMKDLCEIFKKEEFSPLLVSCF